MSDGGEERQKSDTSVVIYCSRHHPAPCPTPTRLLCCGACDVCCLVSCKDVVVHAPLGPPSPGLPNVHSTFHSFHQPWELDQTRQINSNNANGNNPTGLYYQPMFCTDIVPIKVLFIFHNTLRSFCSRLIVHAHLTLTNIPSSVSIIRHTFKYLLHDKLFQIFLYVS